MLATMLLLKSRTANDVQKSGLCRKPFAKVFFGQNPHASDKLVQTINQTSPIQ